MLPPDPKTIIIIKRMEPKVTLDMASKTIHFLLDTGAAYSLLNSFSGTLSLSLLTYVKQFELKNSPRHGGLHHPCIINGGKLFAHSLVMPECPSPVLGRNILQKLGTHLIFGNPFPNILAFLSERETHISVEPKQLDSVNPEIWATKVPRRIKNAVPVKVQLKDPCHYPHQRQYPLKPEAKTRLPIINQFLKYDLLKSCLSPCNTPILLVKVWGTIDWSKI